MFERYTEQARRTIFFARYEASQLGIREITPDCLLLGMLREDGELAVRWLDLATWEACEAVTQRAKTSGTPLATSVDLPLSPGAKRVVAYAAEEADAAGSRHIGTEHLFLGLLREGGNFAASRAAERGLSLEQARAGVGKAPAAMHAASAPVRAARGQQVTLAREDGSEVAALAWVGRIPAIGESIRLAAAVSGAAVFRVMGVEWRVRNAGAGPSGAGPSGADQVFSQVMSIVLTVRAEE